MFARHPGHTYSGLLGVLGLDVDVDLFKEINCKHRRKFIFARSEMLLCMWRGNNGDITPQRGLDLCIKMIPAKSISDPFRLRRYSLMVVREQDEIDARELVKVDSWLG